MTAQTNHLVFVQPDEPQTKVWRYMDFTKYVSFLHSRSLYFCRSDLFEDLLEGSYSQANIAMRPQVYKDIPVPDPQVTMERFSRFAEWSRKWTFINCWHLNNYESAAMWKLYARSAEAIALQSTYEGLARNLPDNVHLGLVNYIDYEKEWIPEGNSFYPFMHKRRSFEYEREVRGIIQDLPIRNDQIPVGKEPDNTGLLIPVHADDLVETVFVAPIAPDWFLNLVRDVSEKYELHKAVVRSSLDRKPVW